MSMNYRKRLNVALEYSQKSDITLTYLPLNSSIILLSTPTSLMAS